ncbi:hypothetical protein PCANC_13506 [Puccinia coronata f. sp. avenae]|jgi:hypothetical protein|uniref:Uncharacterized protein n=1 Tax=Puccinia coronata f. sp. avenae TaxID=200324 RepID=A0A2N5V4P6_9BASI|nr:hypothetical protein PCASD_12599 [Puccinia coronata f. sp. avenae]PLW44964.1 hypothetical protein PCANC_13506 [Puccinia coronata f. sp. avenae]
MPVASNQIASSPIHFDVKEIALRSETESNREELRNTRIRAVQSRYLARIKNLMPWIVDQDPPVPREYLSLRAEKPIQKEVSSQAAEILETLSSSKDVCKSAFTNPSLRECLVRTFKQAVDLGWDEDGQYFSTCGSMYLVFNAIYLLVNSPDDDPSHLFTHDRFHHALWDMYYYCGEAAEHSGRGDYQTCYRYSHDIRQLSKLIVTKFGSCRKSNNYDLHELPSPFDSDPMDEDSNATDQDSDEDSDETDENPHTTEADQDSDKDKHEDEDNDKAGGQEEKDKR